MSIGVCGVQGHIGIRKILPCKSVTYLHCNFLTTFSCCCLNFFADCGAGIGRVTKNLLLPMFDTVDMVEQNPEFLQKAKDYLVRGQTVKILS